MQKRSADAPRRQPRSSFCSWGQIAAIALAVLSPASGLADIDFDANGKHYRLVTTPATWANARIAAFASTYGGSPGHLATIESDAENAAIFARIDPLSNADVAAAMPWNTYRHPDSFARSVWLGTADNASSVDGSSEGNFYWLGATPTAATVQFWQGGQGGSAVAGRYANWGFAGEEPDNWLLKQDHAGMQLDDWPYGAAGEWNDLDGTVAQAYLIEYEAVPEPEIDVLGNASSIADGDSTPDLGDHTDFGSALVEDGTVIRTYTIANTGAATLSITGTPRVQTSGPHAADFAVTVYPADSVAAAASTTFQVMFDPSATGMRHATLVIANNDGDENPYDFSVRGQGTTPPELQAPAVSTGTTAILRWTSYSNQLYTIHHSTNLPGGFSVRQDNIPATPPMNVYTDVVSGVRSKFWKVSTQD